MLEIFRCRELKFYKINLYSTRRLKLKMKLLERTNKLFGSWIENEMQNGLAKMSEQSQAIR